jgi:transient receptor potential cation channel subfamily V protein 6
MSWRKAKTVARNKRKTAAVAALTSLSRNSSIDHDAIERLELQNQAKRVDERRKLERVGLRRRVRQLNLVKSLLGFVALVCAARALARLESGEIVSSVASFTVSGVLTSASTRRFAWELALSASCALFVSLASRKLEQAKDELSKIGGSAARDVEMQTAHAASAGGIWAALKTGDEEGVKRLVGARPKCLVERGPVGETPLHLMLLYGGGMSFTDSPQLRSAKFIGETRPAAVNDVYVGSEYYGESALHIAVVNRNVELVRWLLQTSEDTPALLAARATGRFFSKGQPCYYGEYALSFAVSTGQSNIVDILLRAGADALAQDTHGNTCLHMAVIHNQPEMYDQLCKSCTKPKELEQCENGDRLTPLLFAARSGYQEMFNFLLERICVTEWSYGPVTCKRMPLMEIDTKQRERPGALEEIVEQGHLNLLCLPLVQELLQRKWDCFIGKLFYRRMWHLFLFLMTMTCIHITFDAGTGLDSFVSTAAQTAKTGILGVVVAQLAYEWSHRKNASGQSVVSTLFCVAYLGSIAARNLIQDELVSDGMLAVSFLFAWFHFVWLFMGFKSTGHFVIMVYEILIDDVAPFTLILGFFLVAFSTAMYVTIQPASSRSLSSFYEQTLSCFEWLTNGGYEGDVVASVQRGETLMTVLMATFTILGGVVLLNLLIAMMGDTYAKVSENAVAKWQLQRARIMLRLERGIPTKHRDRLSRDVWISIENERFLQVQLVNGLTALEQDHSSE